jgi:hypothetical protein
MNEVADVRFNRAAPPPPAAPPKKFVKPTGAGGMRGPTLDDRGMQTMKDYGAMLGGGGGAGGTAPAYSGMMGARKQQTGLAQALGQGMGPRELTTAAPTQAYDPNAGKERADQSLMGPKESVARSPQEFVGNLKEAADMWGVGGSGYSRDSKDPTVQTGYSMADFGNGTVQATDMWAGTAPGRSGDNPIVGAVGDILSGLSGQISHKDMANIEKYFGESLGGYRDIMQNSRDIMDPAKRDAWESAARDDLNATVGADKMQNLRMNAAAAGRGGFMSSNADTSIYGNAANALASGERGIAQDRFSRDLSATQAGNAGLGAGASALQDLIGEGFTSNKEVLSYLLTGMEKGADIGQLLADMVGGKWTA